MSTEQGVAVVTGATGGLGRATCRALAARGLRIVVAHYRDHDRARELARDLGSGSIAVDIDVTDPACGTALAQEVEPFGRLDVLVNNAGVMFEVPFDRMSPEQWHTTISTNLTSIVHVTQPLLGLLRCAPAPTIVSVASQLAFKGAAGYSAYCASKAGVVGLTRALARELGPEILVTALAPGPVETAMTAPYLTEGWIAERTGTSIIGRIARPEEVADAVVAMTEPGARLLHGQTLHINGGGVLA